MKDKYCYSCGRKSLTWDNDIDADQIDEGEGIVHYYRCRSCGARFTVYVPFHFREKIQGYRVEPINKGLADDFLQRHHYLAQQGNGFLGKVQYGLFTSEDKFVGCIVFAGISVIETLIGAFEGFDRFSDQSGFWELTRLAMDDENKKPNLTSWFVAKAIRRLRHEYNVRALISYADSKYHNGFIYQATSFKYYGLTAPKTDFYEDIGGGVQSGKCGAVA